MRGARRDDASDLRTRTRRHDETRGAVELVEDALAVRGAGAEGGEAVVAWLVQQRA